MPVARCRGRSGGDTTVSTSDGFSRQPARTPSIGPAPPSGSRVGSARSLLPGGRCGHQGLPAFAASVAVSVDSSGCVDGGGVHGFAERVRERYRVVVGPEVHVEEPWLLVEGVVVQLDDLDTAGA